MDSFDALAEAYVRLRAKDDGTLERDVLGIVGKVATSAASLWAGKKLIDVGVAGLDELKQAQVVSTQTAVQLQATGQAAGVSAAHIDELGQKMLDLAGFDDEAARSAANVLLQFDKIKGVAAFDRVEKDAADLSVTLASVNGGVADIAGAARTLGLALEDPEKGVRLLRSANIALSQSQQDQLKAAVASNDVAEQQEIILGAVEARVHGAAAAYGDTLAGSLKRSTEELKNAKAELVSGFAPAVQLGADVATGLAHVVEEMPDLLQGAVGGVVFFGGGIASLIQPTSNLIQLINSIRAARVAAAAATATETVAIEANAVANEEAAVASGGMLAALGPLGLALGVAAAGLTLFALNSSDGEQAAQALDSALQKLDTDLANLSAGEGPKTLTGDLKAFLDQLVSTDSGGDKYRDALNKIGISTSDFADVLGQGSQAAGRFLADLSFHGVGDDAVRVLGELVHATEQHAQSTLLADVAQGRLTQAQLDNAAATHLNASGTTDWIATLHALQPAITAATSSTDGLTASQEDQMSGARNLFEAQQAMTAAEHGITQAARGVQDAQRGVTDANRRLEDSYRTVEQAQQRVIDAQAALDVALQGASDEDLGKANLDLSDAQQRQADALEAVADAQHKLDRDTRLGRTRALTEDQEALHKAQNDLQRSTYGVSDAQDALNKTQQKGSEQDPEVIQARKDLTAANEGLEAANRGVADALQGVEDAQQRVIDAKDAVNQAYLTEADASSKLKDAQDGLHGATVTANQQLENEIAALQGIDGLIAPGSPAKEHLDEYIRNLFVLAGIFDPSLLGGSQVQLTFPANGAVAYRAGGGPLDPNVPTWVGEDEPELAYHNFIYPSGQKRRTSGAAKGGDTYNHYEYTIVNPEPEPASGTIRREFARQSVLNGG